ncbi:MAG: aldehyde dehydrogenase family protein [Bacteroidota bacterium]
MTAQEAFQQLDPKAWANTSVVERLALIEQIQKNIKIHAKELGASDAQMKNELLGKNMVSVAEGIGATIIPMANTLMGIKRLYESLVRGEMPEALSTRKIGEELYEVEVYPIHAKDKLVAQKQRGYLHISGTPKQSHPMDKPAGIIAISGAGNYSSSLEMAMALFLENKAVIHKAHQLNEASDLIWEKIFAPLIKRKALVFCDADQGRALSQLEGLHSIYFTGSTGVARAIQKAAKAPLISECGGNNPCIILPGHWTDKEIRHQAIQIASIGKLNGGAACGRPQTIVTSKSWPQRTAFLDALKKALAEETYACGSYYPGVDKTHAKFLDHQPTAEIIQPENGKYPKSDVLLIRDVALDDFAIQNEAFCQIFSEIQLDTTDDINDFITQATDFCNHQLLGTLGCMILATPSTLEKHEDRIHQAIRELNYGGIALNTVPPNIWLNAYLTWGGCGETSENLVSGIGNFGNALNFDNIVKSVLIDDFNASSFELTHKKRVEHLLENASYFAIDQNWGRFAKLAGQMMVDQFKGKDF